MMYEKTLDQWMEELGDWIEGFEREIELCARASDPYPCDETYINQCTADIKSCLHAIGALEKLRAVLAQPQPDAL